MQYNEFKKVFAEDLAGHTGVIVTHLGVAVDIKLDDGSVHTVRVKRKSGHVVGDRVEVTKTGLKTLPRKTELRRIDNNDRVKILAANLDCVGFLIAPIPVPPRGFIDRAIITANAAGITPFVVVNKCDLEGSQELYDYYSELYKDLVDVFLVSAETGENLDQLYDFFSKGHTGAFIGDSGVGKSSLLNALLPELDLWIGEINERLGLGRHTTTASLLADLPNGGAIIDTPGFKDFGVIDIAEEDLAFCIPEFLPYLQHGCKFNDCRHISEPGCPVREAVANGEIPETRYTAYREVLEELLAYKARRRPY